MSELDWDVDMDLLCLFDSDTFMEESDVRVAEGLELVVKGRDGTICLRVTR